MRRTERGSAMVVAMFVLLLAGMVGGLVLERGRGVAAATRHDREQMRALYAAEGALAMARHAMARDPRYAGGTVEVAGRPVAIEVDGWTVAVVTKGCRLDVVLAPSAGLPHVVSQRER